MGELNDLWHENMRLKEDKAQLLAALEALGAKPDGYCFCISQEQIEAGHTGECKDAQIAMKGAGNE